jgi:site-specific recombinase XerD
VLRSLIERADTTRGSAIFALGYWAGCRVTDVAHMEHDHLQITTKAGSITVGHKAAKQRTIDLHNEARSTTTSTTAAVTVTALMSSPPSALSG